MKALFHRFLIIQESKKQRVKKHKEYSMFLSVVFKFCYLQRANTWKIKEPNLCKTNANI